MLQMLQKKTEVRMKKKFQIVMKNFGAFGALEHYRI